MTKRGKIIAGVIAAALFVAAALAGGIHCGGGCDSGPTVIDPGVDAGEKMRELDSKELEAREEAEKKIREIEDKRRDELDDFTEEQRDEYEKVRDKGPDAVTEWLRDFDREKIQKGQGP